MNRPSRSILAYLSIFFAHESAGLGPYLSFLSQSAYFFAKLCVFASSHNTYTFKHTEGYRCFNDLIDQDLFEEIEGSIPGK